MSKTRRSSQKGDESKAAVDAEAESIWGKLSLEADAQKQDTAGGGLADPADVVALFCGKKRSGKTSLIERFINPQKEVGDQPKPTVALDYKYARYASDTSAGKSLAHIYDLGGDESQFSDLTGVVITPDTVERLMLAITLDLSEPWSVLPSLTHWLEMLRSQVEQCLEHVTGASMPAARRVQALRTARKEAFAGHADAANVRPIPVPLVILGTKWDVFVTETDAEKRKWLCRALRYHAHLHGAVLVCTSTAEKTSMNAMRGTLRSLFFGGGSGGGSSKQSKDMAEQFDHSSRPIFIPLAKDSFESIGPAGGTSTADARSNEGDWARLIEGVFPKGAAEQKAAAAQDLRTVNDEIAKHAEAAIDGMVEQKGDELSQYRRQAERNERLASEGIDARRAPGVVAC